MLRQLPVKKEYLLIASVIILLGISYQLAFKKTLEAWQINRGLKAQLARSTDLSIQPAYLVRKNNNLSKIIGTFKTDTVAFRSNEISTISVLAEKENVKLSDVPLQDPVYHTDQFTVQKLSFEGDFFSLTKLLDQLQRLKGIGQIRSVSYRIPGIKSNGKHTSKLILEVYLESVNR